MTALLRRFVWRFVLPRLWIDVHDRMPPVGERVFIHAPGHPRADMIVSSWHPDEGAIPDHAVAFWMPLPPPPGRQP